MIHELYVPTRGVDFLQLAAVTDSADPVQVTLEHEGAVITDVPACRPIHHHNQFYWQFHIADLAPNTRYVIQAWQVAGRPRQVIVNTLVRPAGARKLRLGILADPHCTGDRPSNARLYAQSFDLFEHSLQRLVDRGAQAIIVPGDLTDAGSQDQLDRCRQLCRQCSVPVHPIVGNHEYQPQRFLDTFKLGEGYRSLTIQGVHLVLLHTHSANDLSPSSHQLRWLAADLAEHAAQDTLVFSHFALVRHPYQAREKNPCIHNHHDVADLLARHPQVRAAFAGHKNIPTRTDQGHVAHMTCPQICRAPCSYDLVDLYDEGLVRHIFEIDESHLLAQSKAQFSQPEDAAYRFGLESGRNFSVTYDALMPCDEQHDQAACQNI